MVLIVPMLSETYITYLNVNFDVPEHLNPILSMKRS